MDSSQSQLEPQQDFFIEINKRIPKLYGKAKTILKRVSVNLHYSISRLSYPNQDSKQLAKGESADE